MLPRIIEGGFYGRDLRSQAGTSLADHRRRSVSRIRCGSHDPTDRRTQSCPAGSGARRFTARRGKEDRIVAAVACMRKLSKPEVIRCPYCVEDGQFRVMSVQAGNDWYLCPTCGHLALPSSRLFDCTCGRCVKLKSRTQGRGHSRVGDFQNAEQGRKKLD